MKPTPEQYDYMDCRPPVKRHHSPEMEAFERELADQVAAERASRGHPRPLLTGGAAGGPKPPGMDDGNGAAGNDAPGQTTQKPVVGGIKPSAAPSRSGKPLKAMPA